MRKLISKGKHTVKVDNHPHISTISKSINVTGGQGLCRIFEMHLKLRLQKVKILILLHQNLMVTTNQKSIVVMTQINKRNLNTTLKKVIKSQEERKKRGKEEKKRKGRKKTYKNKQSNFLK